MATYEMYRPVNKAGTSVWVWATSEGEAAQVFVAAGRARSLDGVVRCRLDTVTASMFGRPPRRRDSFRAVDSSTGADLGPLADLERTGTMSWAMDSDDPNVGKLKVVSLLESLPGLGKVKARRMMDEVGIAENRRVQGLGAQQRAALLKQLG